MEKVVRLPSNSEKEYAEDNNKKPWFPQVGSWWKTQSGKIMFKLDMFPDMAFMLSEPKEQSGQPGDIIPS